jgi:hypothetical protein
MQLPALVIDMRQCRSVDRLLLIDLKEIFMGKFLSGIFASVLAATFSVASVTPVNAALIFVPKMQNVKMCRRMFYRLGTGGGLSALAMVNSAAIVVASFVATVAAIVMAIATPASVMAAITLGTKATATFIVTIA